MPTPTKQPPPTKQTGAEAVLTFSEKTVTKDRIAKSYRNELLDEALRKSRTKREIKVLNKAPVRVPKIVSTTQTIIEMERITGERLRDELNKATAEKYSSALGHMIRKFHEANIVHGDLTTSNVLVEEDTDELVLIDFGLAVFSRRVEDKAVDLHVLKETLQGSHPLVADDFWKYFSAAYGDEAVLERLRKVESRGRYKEKY